MRLTTLLWIGLLAGAAHADNWPMRGRDMQHTGRADFVIPESRLNDGLFDVFRWQTPAPGPVGSSSMVFTDRPGQSPEGVVAAGYHWPKGVQLMDRHTGALVWANNPRGGESIGSNTPAFSLDGQTVYVTNDATDSEQWPSGHPLMAMAVDGNGLSYWHNGNMTEPWLVQMNSPTIAPDGRVFAHAWVNRPGAALDTGSELVDAWAAATGADCGNSDPTLFMVEDQLRVVIAGRDGWIHCYDGATGDQLWQLLTWNFWEMHLPGFDATTTVDPATGNIYVGGFDGGRVYIMGLDADGGLLWPTACQVVATGGNHRVQNAGCLSHDGATYYFTSASQSSASGALYAIDTASGTVKWTFATTDQQDGEQVGSSPIVTPNGVILFGANWAGRYYALQDLGSSAQLLDELEVAPGGVAQCAPSLSEEGLLYLPMKTQWTTRNDDAEPDQQIRDLFTAVDLSGSPHELPPEIVAEGWPMLGRDMQHTGRADYVIPENRLNSGLFDQFRWQTPAPGPVGSSSMVFTDRPGMEPEGVVAAGYHWPKGVQLMDRHTGAPIWANNPRGGESIGSNTPAFSPNGQTIYMINDATDSEQWPSGHPLMAMAVDGDGLSYWHNGSMSQPWLVQKNSPTIAPDGRVFAHAWVNRPGAALDTGSELVDAWAAATGADCGNSDPTLFMVEDQLRVVIAGRNGWIRCYDGDTGAQLWSRNTYSSPYTINLDATVTVDPANGNIYAAGFSSTRVFVVGLNSSGGLLWSMAGKVVATASNRRVQNAGCLSHDGSTYYFTSASQTAASGALYAINTATGTVKWTFATTDQQVNEDMGSSPMVTPNGVILFGANWSGRYYAVRDIGSSAQLLDELVLAPGGAARCTPSLSEEGLLYLPMKTQWTTRNAGAEPDDQVRDLYAAVDLSAFPHELPPVCALDNPASLMAFALNGQVRLEWPAIQDPAGCFSHYRVYRSTSSFSNVVGMTPVAEVLELDPVSYLDDGLVNGQAYWYAVTAVDQEGAEIMAVTSVGPRRPFDESDLQVACMSRSALYPRYQVNYTTHEVTEPNGFGPYMFSVATSLGGGQSCEDPRWPAIGEPVSWTAVVRNRGSNPWNGELPFAWNVDGVLTESGSRTVALAPGDTARFVLERTWDGVEHLIEFGMEPGDERDLNNHLEQSSRSVAFLSYIDATRMEAFRENSLNYPGADTDDFIDWINRHSERFNGMFEDGNCGKRVHLDLLQVLPDTQPDPAAPPTIDYAIFPFRYRATEGDARLSGYYNPTDDIDYGLLHEMGHQLGLIDIYQFDTGSSMNQVSGLEYWAHDDLMRGCSPFIGPHSAGGMNHWLDEAHGYYGQYLYQLPEHVAMRFLAFDGQPLANASVEVFQVCERPGLGKVMTNQVKCSGITDANGVFLLPNVPIDEALMPATCIGDQLHDNPFGYVAVVGTNGVLHFRVSTQGFSDYAWLDITEANVAYWAGQTGTATFERTLSLGSEPIRFLPLEVCENDLEDWAAWTNGTVEKTLDDSRVHQGSHALKVSTTGDMLTLRYPASGMGQYDLSGCDTLRFWAWMESAHPMQNNTPWIRLGNSQGYVEYQSLVNEWGGSYGQWQEIRIPLAASDSWQRQEHGLSSLDNVNWMEIRLDIWDYAFTVWIDGLRITPVGCVTDCNGNGEADALDVSGDYSQDLNGNGLPDECESPESLAAPQVVVVVAGTDLALSWLPVPGAQSYRVLESLAPYGAYLPVATVVEPAWTATGVIPGAPRFYRVIADSQPPASRGTVSEGIPRLEPNHGLRLVPAREVLRMR